jgi:hypothetical protein
MNPVVRIRNAYCTHWSLPGFFSVLLNGPRINVSSQLVSFEPVLLPGIIAHASV